jgi:hypothetical protein
MGLSGSSGRALWKILMFPVGCLSLRFIAVFIKIFNKMTVNHFLLGVPARKRLTPLSMFFGIYCFSNRLAPF